MNTAELVDELARLSQSVEKSLTRINVMATEYAIAENEYRKAKAVATIGLTDADMKVDERKAHVDKACESERLRAHLAEANWRASIEAVRARRAQLSAMQSVAGALKEEMAFERTRTDT